MQIDQVKNKLEGKAAEKKMQVREEFGDDEEGEEHQEIIDEEELEYLN